MSFCCARAQYAAACPWEGGASGWLLGTVIRAQQFLKLQLLELDHHTQMMQLKVVSFLSSFPSRPSLPLLSNLHATWKLGCIDIVGFG